MDVISTAEIKDFLYRIQGREITLAEVRKEFNILPGTKSFDAVRNILFQLAEANIVRPTGKKNGAYKVITQVQPVRVFGIDRERRPPFGLLFPRNYDTMEQIDIANDVVIREGDLILISGVSNFGKTTLCMSFCGENIDEHPVLMGNEYTVQVEDTYEPSPRFLNRLDSMDWIYWTNGDGIDKFTLLPVREDYAEHIVKNKINIIDWINIDTGEHFLIGSILEKIKKNLGRGVAIVALQKGEGADAGRGGQFTKDFADLEILVDRFGKSDVLMTIGKVKEYKHPVIGNTYAYSIASGVKIIGFRQVKKCPSCKGQGFKASKPCEECDTKKYVDFIPF